MDGHGTTSPGEWAYYPSRMLASVLLDRPIINEEGQQVADVDDLIIGGNGKVEQLVLETDGRVDFDERLVAIPFQSLGFTNWGIVLDLTRKELEKRPEFMYEN
jgi:sporulation protein YlmC with PRC-barrel domain